MLRDIWVTKFKNFNFNMYIFFLNRNMSDEHDEDKVFKHEIILPWYKTIQELE